MAYKGLDGYNYDTLTEKRDADALYLDRQQLETQEIINQQRQEQQELAKMQMRKQEEIEKSRQEFEENQRVQRLFDDIGMNKNTFDNFTDYLFVRNHEVMRNEKEIKRIDELVEQYSSKETEYNTLVESKNKLKGCQELKSDVLNNNYISFNLYSEKLGSNESGTVSNFNLIASADVSYGIRKKSKWAIPLLLIIGLFFSKYYLIFIILSALIIFCVKHFKKKAIKQLEEEINTLSGSYTDKDIEVLEKQMNEFLEEYNNLKKDIFKRRWDDFYNFRLNHYNHKIENLLIELGYKEHIKSFYIEYDNITKDKSKGTGQIDDYISYFNNKV